MSFLDKQGLARLWANILTLVDTKVPTSRTINGKSLSADVTLSASDVGAAESEHNHDDVYYTKTEIDTTLADKVDASEFDGHTHVVSDISDLTATATELNYMDGVTSNVQTQLDGKSVSGHTHDTIAVKDTRNTDLYPSDYPNRTVHATFTNSALPSGLSSWMSGVTVKGWTGSNYKAWQLMSDANDDSYTGRCLYFRTGYGSTWGSWRQIIDSSGGTLTGNLTAPTLTCTDSFSLGRYSDSTVGTKSFASGHNVTASGNYSFATGYATKASGNGSCATGDGTTALAYQLACGRYNNSTVATGYVSSSNQGTAFVIGNGAAGTAGSNAFRVTYTGTPYAKSALTTTGADYAEFFEWQDMNLNAEDRRGYFVTLDGDKIKIAQSDDYILGIISGMPSVVGNGDEDWMGRYVFDEFGAFVYEDFEYEEEVVDETTGEVTTVTKTGKKYKENPNYDPSMEYVQREDRPEWDYVGMLGVLSVRDDGTCQVNGYCKVTDGGIATASETGYRVVKRVNDHIVKVVFR